MMNQSDSLPGESKRTIIGLSWASLRACALSFFFFLSSAFVASSMLARRFRSDFLELVRKLQKINELGITLHKHFLRGTMIGTKLDTST